VQHISHFPGGPPATATDLPTVAAQPGGPISLGGSNAVVLASTPSQRGMLAERPTMALAAAVHRGMPRRRRPVEASLVVESLPRHYGGSSTGAATMSGHGGWPELEKTIPILTRRGGTESRQIDVQPPPCVAAQ
jgi:hypothetical protein